MNGGRFNSAGVEALYLALSIEGMIAEMGHGFGNRFEPLTICSYDVDVADVVDLRTDADREAAGVDEIDLSCAWAEDRGRGRVPGSWALAETLRSNGAAGILVPSFAHRARTDMTNLVLWRWGPDLPWRVQVHDPSGRLPKDQLSRPTLA